MSVGSKKGAGHSTGEAGSSASRRVPAASREEIATLARRAGLDLSPEHFEQLCDAWKHVERMIARIPRERPSSDEPAHGFVAARAAPHG